MSTGALAMPVAVLRRLETLSFSQRRLIGIAGPPASGKSTLAVNVVEHLERTGLTAVAAPMDGFHFSDAEIQRLCPTEYKGAPATFDSRRLLQTIRRLRSGREAVDWPLYQRGIPDPQRDAVRIGPDVACVVVEGNYLALDLAPWRQIPRLLDELWFMACSDDVIRPRLMARQLAKGRSLDAAARHVDDGDLRNAVLVRERLAAAPTLTIPCAGSVEHPGEGIPDPAQGR